MRLVQVKFLATLRAALGAFYLEYKDDAGGYGYLRLELRAYVCGARVGEVVVASGGIATAILCVCCCAAVRLKMGMSGVCMMHVVNVLIKWRMEGGGG